MKYLTHLIHLSLFLSLLMNACSSHKTEPADNAEYSGKAVFLYPVEINGKWGYINQNGKIVIEPEFEAARPFSEGLAIVYLDGAHGYIKSDGVFAIAPEYIEVNPFSGGLAAVKPQKKLFSFAIGKGNYTYINRLGKKVIEGDFYNPQPFSDNRAAVMFKKSGKYAYIDEKGNRITEAKFDRAFPFAGGVAVGGIKGGNDFLIDKNGNTIKEFHDIKIKNGFSDGLALVFADNRHGFINTKGELVIPLKLGVANSFSEGMAAVEHAHRGKYGFINKQGDFVIEPVYLSARNFYYGLAAVETTEGWGYINQSNEMVIEPQYYDAYPFYGQLAKVKPKGGDLEGLSPEQVKKALKKGKKLDKGKEVYINRSGTIIRPEN